METSSSGCCCCCHKQLYMNINAPSAFRSFGKILMMWQDKQTASKHHRVLRPRCFLTPSLSCVTPVENKDELDGYADCWTSLLYEI